MKLCTQKQSSLIRYPKGMTPIGIKKILFDKILKNKSDDEIYYDVFNPSNHNDYMFSSMSKGRHVKLFVNHNEDSVRIEFYTSCIDLENVCINETLEYSKKVFNEQESSVEKYTDEVILFLQGGNAIVKQRTCDVNQFQKSFVIDTTCRADKEHILVKTINTDFQTFTVDKTKVNGIVKSGNVFVLGMDRCSFINRALFFKHFSLVY